MRANIQGQNAREEPLLIQYDQVVLTALADVESAVVTYGREQTRRSRLAEAVEANQWAVEVANDLYTMGPGDFLNVLESQRSSFASQSELVHSEATVSASVVALYKALGGGWQSD